MGREKITKKIGDSIGIIFNREERVIYNLRPNQKIIITIETGDDNNDT